MNFYNFRPGVNKYRNKEVKVDGYNFKSKKEAGVYQDFKLGLNSGEIKRLELQKKFELIPNQKGPDGKIVERAISYIADFYVEYADGEKVVIDCKGMRLPVYTIKRKLMLWVHGIKIKEI